MQGASVVRRTADLLEALPRTRQPWPHRSVSPAAADPEWRPGLDIGAPRYERKEIECTKREKNRKSVDHITDFREIFAKFLRLVTSRIPRN